MKTETVNTGLGEFFKSLLPNILKKDLMTDLTHSFDDLNQITLPMYQANIDDVTFKGELAKSMEKLLKRSKIRFKTNCYNTIATALQKLSENEEQIIKMVENDFAREIIKDAIDYKRLNVIHYLESINFINEYARKFILGLIAQEFDDNTASKITGPVDRATIEFANDYKNMETFVKVLEICSGDVQNFMHSIQKLDGHIFNPAEADAMKAVNGSTMDPHSFGLIPVRMNPFYHIGLAINKWRIARYELNVEEKAKLQLMLLALQDSKSKTNDKEKQTNLEKQIKYRSNQINILSEKIRQMEEQD